MIKNRIEYWLTFLILIITINTISAQELTLGINAGYTFSKAYFLPGYSPVKSTLGTQLVNDNSSGVFLKFGLRNNGFTLGYQSTHTGLKIGTSGIDTFAIGNDTVVFYPSNIRYGIYMQEFSIGYGRNIQILPKLYLDLNLSIAAVRSHVSIFGRSDIPYTDSLPTPPKFLVGGLTKIWRIGLLPGIGLSYRIENVSIGLEAKYHIRQSLLDSKGVYTLVGPNEYEYSRYGLNGGYVRVSLSFAYRFYKFKKGTKDAPS